MSGIYGDDPEDKHFENKLLEFTEKENDSFEEIFGISGELNDQEYDRFMNELKYLCSAYKIKLD